MKCQRLYLIAVGAIIAACCPPARSADSQVPLVYAALASQVTGPGGCDTVDVIASNPSPFFPDVQLLEGLCQLEHGDTAWTQVAIEPGGQVIQLASPGGFNLLRRRHPGRIAPGEELEYALLVARFMGIRHYGGRPVLLRDRGFLEKLRALKLSPSAVGVSGLVQDEPRIAVVRLVLEYPESFDEVTLVVVRENANAYTAGRTTWRASPHGG